MGKFLEAFSAFRESFERSYSTEISVPSSGVLDEERFSCLKDEDYTELETLFENLRDEAAVLASLNDALRELFILFDKEK